MSWEIFVDNYWLIIADNYPLFLGGIGTTLWMVGVSLLIGLCIAVPCGMILALSRKTWLRIPVHIYSYFFRGTPMLVQLYLIYYGIGLQLGEIEGIREHFLWPILREAWPWALLAFTLNTGAYTTEIVRGFIETTPHGEIEAGLALGMHRGLLLRRIILPSAVRRALPAYGNEIIFMLHGSAIASVVTIMDITGVARNLYAIYYEPFVPFITAGLIYLCITSVIVVIFIFIERHLLKHLSLRN